MVSLGCIAKRALALVLFLLVDIAYAAPAPGSAASFYVPSLPGLRQDPNHPLHIYAGHLPSTVPTGPPSNDIQPHLYFLMLKNRRVADKERVIIWFNGGPGCSSFDGAMMEVGPWRVDGQGGLKLLTSGGWEEYATIIYLDQPVGTGFSYTSTDQYVHELGEAANQVIRFMRNFYDVFPELEFMDTWIAGESFAGQYIPYFADAFLKTTLIKAQLKGITIGNGWIDGRTQYPAYYEFAVKNKMIKPDNEARVKVELDRCMDYLNETTVDDVNMGECEGIMSAITKGLMQTVNGKQVCLNVYDIRLVDDFPACGMHWPPDLASVYTYLRRDDVIQALHATAKSEAWVECNGRVGQQLTLMNSPPSITLFPHILSQIPIMLFAGDQDFICNYIGMERLIEGLTWNGGKGLGDAETLDWEVDGAHAGSWVTARNLSYVKLSGASHMVGFDVPNVAHDMMLRFMGVDFHSLSGGSASIPSSVGGVSKPGIFFDDTKSTGSSSSGGRTSTTDPDVWRSYYNSGTMVLVFLLIILGIVLVVYVARRRRRYAMLPKAATYTDHVDLEERIPLSSQTDADVSSRELLNATQKAPNGGDLTPTHQPRTEAIFDIGDEEEDQTPRTAQH
ncbi:alpha/beta-hydrolase [Dacryopinax primogenitus]|uniref:Pheromone-processing carboxypeptidase KEX1 n=1 Tax=Dacryopinax primogenitus (strain DJM 731) TaxID=1858805 RepID=M5GFE6_DACPD|nr:alpha/beta-hydrolase [Dacryopinax primogenitus]EJU06202.1 alpha/beta-hydrolase [Dacryopinax primogenitus]